MNPTLKTMTLEEFLDWADELIQDELAVMSESE